MPTSRIEARRPSASDAHEQKRRPRIPATPTQITRYDASAGPILRISTNSVVTHKVMPTPPVWLKPVRQETKRLRGYLKSSIHDTGSAGGRAGGNSMRQG